MPVEALARKFEILAGVLDERTRRLDRSFPPMQTLSD
jgi:hypothetical protein